MSFKWKKGRGVWKNLIYNSLVACNQYSNYEEVEKIKNKFRTIKLMTNLSLTIAVIIYAYCQFTEPSIQVESMINDELVAQINTNMSKTDMFILDSLNEITSKF